MYPDISGNRTWNQIFNRLSQRNCFSYLSGGYIHFFKTYHSDPGIKFFLQILYLLFKIWMFFFIGSCCCQ